MVIKNDLESNKVLQEVVGILEKQSLKGFKKYGAFVEAENLSTEQWIDHAREEIVDTLVYLTCLKERLKNERGDRS